MIITSASKSYFYFQFDEKEAASDGAKRFIDEIKSEIPANSGRYWIRDKYLWAIHKDYFDIFMKMMYIYYKKLVFSQNELF